MAPGRPPKAQHEAPVRHARVVQQQARPRLRAAVMQSRAEAAPPPEARAEGWELNDAARLAAATARAGVCGGVGGPEGCAATDRGATAGATLWLQRSTGEKGEPAANKDGRMDEAWTWFNVVTMGLRDVDEKSEISDPDEVNKLEANSDLNRTSLRQAVHNLKEMRTAAYAWVRPAAGAQLPRSAGPRMGRSGAAKAQ